MTGSRLAPILLLLAGILLPPLSGCSSERETNAAETTRSRATPVIVETVVYRPEQVRLKAVGTSRARKSVMLYPAVPGEVKAVKFEAGQRVEAGDVLVQLDDREERLAVELAKVRLAEAERLLRRYRRSEGSGAVTVSDLDTARTAVEAARIELDRARVALEDRRVVAPFDGVIGVTDVDPGARIDTNTAIAPLDDRDVLLVHFDVPENLIARLRLGDSVSVSPWTARGGTFTGRVVDIGSRIDPVSRTFQVRAEVENPDDRLRPGMSFRVSLDLDGPAFPVVPEVALQWGGDGSYVWRIVEGRATRVPVNIVQRHAGEVLVEAELPEDAVVVREGLQRMREGLEVSYRGSPEQMPAGFTPATGRP